MSRLNAIAIRNAVADLYCNSNMDKRILGTLSARDLRGLYNSGRWLRAYTAIVEEACKEAILGDPTAVKYLLDTCAASEFDVDNRIESDNVIGKCTLEVFEKAGLPLEDRLMLQEYTPRLENAAREIVKKVAKSKVIDVEIEDPGDSLIEITTPGGHFGPSAEEESQEG